MQQEIKIIIFTLTIIMLVIFAVSIFLYGYVKKNNKRDNSIFFLLELDLNNWRFKKTNSLLDSFTTNELNDKFSKYLERKIGVGWIDINKLFRLIGPTKSEKVKKAIEYCVQNKSNISLTSEFVFKTFSSKSQNTSFIFNFKFRYISPEKIMIECKTIDKVFDSSLQKKVISKEKLLSNNKKYKLFIAFSMKEESHKSFITFIDKVSSILKTKSIKFFKSNSMIILLFYSDSYRHIKNINKKVHNKFAKAATTTNINSFFDGSTYVECQNLKTESDFSKVMTRVLFGLIKSKIQHEPISFNLKNIQFNEFEEFKEKIISINKMLESNSINFECLPIKSIISKKEQFDFYVPKFDLSEDYWNNYILRINDYDMKINDKFVTTVLNSLEAKTTKKKIFININDYQMLELVGKVDNKDDFIFIINKVKFNDIKQFIQLLNLLEISKIKYGLYVKEFDSEFYSVIANIKPKVVVLSQKFNDYLVDGKIKSKIKIMSAIFITEHLNINLVFTNVNDEMRNEIQILSKKEKYYINKSSHGMSILSMF